MRYLKTFENHNNYEDFTETEAFVKPNVSYCIRLNEVHYNHYHDYSKDYLTIESLEDDNAIRWESSSQLSKKTISASTDNGQTWTAFTASHEGEGEEEYQPTTIATLNAGEKVLIKGENAAYFVSGNANKFGITKNVNISGNIMSLVSGDSFANADELTASYTFRMLFSQCTGLTSAENLILPATTLVRGCYQNMFSSCTSLTTVPELPATTLAEGCYRYMFGNCTSLATEAIVPDNVDKPISSSYCAYMYCGCPITTHNGNYNEKAYECQSLS